MSYFSAFPLFTMSDGSIGMNITARTKIMNAFKADPAAYYEHSIVDGETPEIIADKFYGEADLAWTILLFNEIHNIYTDWPLDQSSLDEYISIKYENPYEVHHYVSIATGNIVGVGHVIYDRFPITNYAYEIELNDSKRKVNLIIPELISSVVTQHKNQMNGK